MSGTKKVETSVGKLNVGSEGNAGDYQTEGAMANQHVITSGVKRKSVDEGPILRKKDDKMSDERQESKAEIGKMLWDTDLDTVLLKLKAVARKPFNVLTNMQNAQSESIMNMNMDPFDWARPVIQIVLFQSHFVTLYFAMDEKVVNVFDSLATEKNCQERLREPLLDQIRNLFGHLFEGALPVRVHLSVETQPPGDGWSCVFRSVVNAVHLSRGSNLCGNFFSHFGTGLNLRAAAKYINGVLEGTLTDDEVRNAKFYEGPDQNICVSKDFLLEKSGVLSKQPPASRPSDSDTMSLTRSDLQRSSNRSLAEVYTAVKTALDLEKKAKEMIREATEDFYRIKKRK